MDVQRFRKADLQRPIEEIEFPELRGVLFDETEKPVLLIRGLEFNELHLVKQELLKNSIGGALKEAVDKANAGETKELVDLATKLLDGALDNKPAPETIYRIGLILRAAVDAEGKPIFQRQDVVKLAKHFPTTFEKLSDKINALSGKPSNVGEWSNGHGQMIVSAPQ